MDFRKICILIEQWVEKFNLAPKWVHLTFTLVAVYFFILIPSGWFFSYLKRKISADFQARVGPSTCGPSGLFQPMADFLKLLQKENRNEVSHTETLWLSIYSMIFYSTMPVIPLGSLVLLVDTEISAFIPFWATLVLALGTILLGLSRGAITGWYGGIRIAVQTLSGVFPAFICLLCAGVGMKSFQWSLWAKSQGFFPWSWNFLSNPFEFVAFIVFVMSGLVILAVSPLDGGFSMSDIHGNVSSFLHGRWLALYQFCRFYVFFMWSVVAVVLFLGAWVLPSWVYTLADGEHLKFIGIVELLFLLIKVFFLMLVIVWISCVTPVSRVDQITNFSWKILSPFALVALVGASVLFSWKTVGR